MSKLLPQFNGISKYLIAAVLIIVPLFPKFPLLHVPGTYVAIRFEDLLLLALAILTFVKILPEYKSFIKDEIVQAFLIFFGVGLLSVLAGAFLTHTVGLSLGLFHWMRRIEYAIPFFAGLTLLAKEKVSENLDFYIKILLIVVIVVFVYGVGQVYLKFPVIITQNEEYAKGIALLYTVGAQLNSTFAGHYDLSSFCVLVLPIFITLFFVLKSKIAKAALFLTSGMGLWLLISSISRTAQVAYLISVGISLILVKKIKAAVIVVLISAIFIGLSSGIQMRFLRLYETFTGKVSMATNITVMAADTVLPITDVKPFVPTPTPVPINEDRSFSIRLNIEWPRAVNAFLKDPLLGIGYSSIDLATDNDYLRILGETGLLGFLAFVLIFIRISKLLIERALPLTEKLKGIELGFIAGVIGAIIGSFLIAFFIDIFEASKFATIFWLLVGYMVYLLRNKERLSL
jgi:hypothetical protein